MTSTPSPPNSGELYEYSALDLSFHILGPYIYIMYIIYNIYYVYYIYVYIDIKLYIPVCSYYVKTKNMAGIIRKNLLGVFAMLGFFSFPFFSFSRSIWACNRPLVKMIICLLNSYYIFF